MSERLLSLSEILLFGRVVEDIVIRTADEVLDVSVATTGNVGALAGQGPVDTVNLADGDRILVRAQNDNRENGIYTVHEVRDNAGNVTHPWQDQLRLPRGTLVRVNQGATQQGIWRQTMPLQSGRQRFEQQEISQQPTQRRGRNRQLEDQLAEDSLFARIYGFSYEGTYYDLPDPTLFLVHGEGVPATGVRGGPDQNAPGNLASRAPNDPSLSGVGAADYQIANDIRVWAYDKADYSIRMDAMTGMLEQVLLDIYFGFDSPAISGAKVSGAKVSGAKVSGAKVSGAKVSGAKVSGAKVSGAKAYGGGD